MPVAKTVDRILVRQGVQSPELDVYFRRTGSGSTNDAVDESFLLDTKFSVLLGEQGSGKSFVLRSIQTHHRKRHERSEEHECLFIDLENDLGSDPYQSLNRKLKGKTSQITLLLDGFDKAAQRYGKKALSVDIQEFLDNHTLIECVILAARRWSWDEEFTRKLSVSDQWNLDYLDLETYKALFETQADFESFMATIKQLSIRPMLRRPLEGFDLARKFMKGERLPESRMEFLKQKTQELLISEEGDTPYAKLREIAEDTALLSSFSQLEINDNVYHSLNQSRKITTDLLKTPLFENRESGYAFAHDAYREYLAASALKKLDERKRNVLLTAQTAQVIHPYHRGIAGILASEDSAFAASLFENDIISAYMSETGWDGSRGTQFLERFFAWVVEEERLPWWGIPPRDERLDQYLRHHSPENTKAFLEPRLRSQSYVECLWAVTAVKIWDVGSEFNETLLEIAANKSEQGILRRAAIEALDIQSLTSWKVLEPLCFDKNDEVRGQAVRAIREHTNLRPSEFLHVFFEGTNDSSYFGVLVVEAMEYGRNLSTSDLIDALKFVEKNWKNFKDKRSLGSIWQYLAASLLVGADQHGIYDVPAALLAELLSERSSHRTEKLDVQKFINVTMLRKTWDLLFRLSEEKEIEKWWGVRGQLIRYGGTKLLDALRDFEPKNDRQKSELEYAVRSAYFHNPGDKTYEKLLSYYPDVAKDIDPDARSRKNREKYKPSNMDIKKQVVDILNLDTAAWGKCVEIVHLGYECAPEDIVKNQFGPLFVTTQWLLDQLPKYIRVRVLKVFHEGNVETEITKKRNPDGSWRMNRYYRELETGFYLAHLHGHTFEPEKYAEMVNASGLWGDDQDRLRTASLNSLLDNHPDVWSDTIFKLLKSGNLTSIKSVFDYLLELENKSAQRVYLARAAERIESFEFETVFDLEALLSYVQALSPDKHALLIEHLRSNLLKRVHEHREGSKNPHWRDKDNVDRLEGFRMNTLLGLGLQKGSEWAWQEVKERLEGGDLVIYRSRHSEFGKIKMREEHLNIWGDWYTDVLLREIGLKPKKQANRRSRSGDALEFQLGDTRRALRNALDTFSTETALRAIAMIRNKSDLPLAARLTLSHDKLELEKWTEQEKWDIKELLSFCRNAGKYPIRSERQLFEATLESLETLNAGLIAGEGVTSFWDISREGNRITGTSPRRETESQNALWGMLKPRLDSLAIVNVIERHINDNRADFWLEVPVEGSADNLRLPVEMKIAGKGRLARDSWLIDPMEKQLLKKYMQPNGIRFGIFLILWHKNERYPYPRKWERKTLLKKLQDEAKRLNSGEGVTIQPILLDVKSVA